MKLMPDFGEELRFVFQVSARRMPRHYFHTLLTYHNPAGCGRTKDGSGKSQADLGGKGSRATLLGIDGFIAAAATLNLALRCNESDGKAGNC